jgi:hypothetical protein
MKSEIQIQNLKSLIIQLRDLKEQQGDRESDLIIRVLEWVLT